MPPRGRAFMKFSFDFPEPSVAFGGTAGFDNTGNDSGGWIGMGVERVNGKNKRVTDLEFAYFRVDCPKSGPTTVQTDLDKPITGEIVRSEIAIDARVRHRKWHFNELVHDAVGRRSNERIDASINVRGEFRKNNKNKADGTLEVTLEGGATYLDLDVSGTEPIVTERPIVDFDPEGCRGVQDFHVKLIPHR